MSVWEVNNNNIDQEKQLIEATQHFRAIEKPLKYGPVIVTLNDLISALHKEFESTHVNIEMVNHILLSYKSNPKEWHKFAKFDRYKYTRNLVDAGNGKFNLMILCWGEGHGSAIHDHSDSHCFMKVLQGELVETRYHLPKANNNISSNTTDMNNSSIYSSEDCENDREEDLVEIGKTTMSLNDVCYINDNLGIHRVENPSNTDASVSLHLYCPPFNSCSVFYRNSGKKVECPVTFWSKYGVRMPKMGDQ